MLSHLANYIDIEDFVILISWNGLFGELIFHCIITIIHLYLEVLNIVVIHFIISHTQFINVQNSLCNRNSVDRPRPMGLLFKNLLFLCNNNMA